ncbi:acyl-CoA dehydratase activase [Bacteroidota bacterium]
MAISAVLFDEKGQVAETFYEFHEGQIGSGLQKLSDSLGPDIQPRIALTSSSRKSIKGYKNIDIQTALVVASQVPEESPEYILHVGAEKFYLIKRGVNGNYESSRTSTSCAAGTGSFLDQQSRRLLISSIEEFCRMAARNEGKVPEIASRCSVFAKTDLIHAQQEGYSQESICDGLCKGLAWNLIDTLFHDYKSGGKILFTGGVSRNQVVQRYLEEMLSTRLTVHPFSHLFGAIGAGLRSPGPGTGGISLKDLIQHYKKPAGQREYFYPALKPVLKRYPDFGKVEFHIQDPGIEGFSGDLQVEIYEDAAQLNPEGIYIGIDIGSTSTKAVISSSGNIPLLGYYTYTSGKPIEAVFSILKAFDNYMMDSGWTPEILGVGTTGSGRNLAGKILNADLILDEITAHAKAAVHLEPDIDTIIEIGGQDAKFTILKQGEVVFSQMNAVCAAGTGSFIEEQSKKLGVPLREYAERVINQKSPLTSDRCTVFMERDLNYLVNQGYSVDELLAAVLYSVRENYFRKVAIEGMIGKKVCFQGATAKNKALVSVFEQRLGQDIFVSKLCHLTGALGVSLTMKEDRVKSSKFRGISIYKEKVPVRTEICDLCNNHCKLTIANIKEEEVAFGFLCGRDYQTPKYKALERGGYNLIKERKKVFQVPVPKVDTPGPTLGIPAALHMYEESRFWQYFFALLGIRTVLSNPGKTRLREGKHLAGAEFCAPIESMYGHVKDLADKADYIFFPVFLESRDRNGKEERNYCYYTQYSPSIVSQIDNGSLIDRFIVPEIDFSRSRRIYLTSLHKSLNKIFQNKINYTDLNKAWDEARIIFNNAFDGWKKLYSTEFRPDKELSVALLGRPYIIFSHELNKSIPEYFSQRNINCFYQDMLPAGIRREESVEQILEKVPWYFAADILGSVEYIARTPGLYPVLVTAFKCAPDSFIIDYFKKILEAYNKPYLLLQIDEHDSSVGYETRIEAALRAFQNHSRSERRTKIERIPEVIPVIENAINGKTLLIPSWDSYSQRLLIALLRRKGIDARLLEPDEVGMRKSMALNTGQCIPINIIAQDFIDYINKYELDPSRTLLWTAENIATCNFRMYPEYLKNLLENQDNGIEKAGVYLGNVGNMDISISTSLQSYFVYMLGGLIRKMGCMTRPFEVETGSTDIVIEDSLKSMENAFIGKRDLESAVGEMARLFNGIKTEKNGSKPEVAIFGDFYVRDHDIMNQGLIKFVENAGGVVVTTPYHDYVKLTVDSIYRRRTKRGDYGTAVLIKVIMSLMNVLDRKYYRHLESIIGIKEEINAASLERHLSSFNVTPYQSGESSDNLLKIFHILEYHPKLSLFVQTNPAFCCPALITEAMTARIKSITGVPVVTVTYDGTSESKNEIILPYLVAATEKVQ